MHSVAVYSVWLFGEGPNNQFLGPQQCPDKTSLSIKKQQAAPFIFNVATSSFGVHCRLTMKSRGRRDAGLCILHKHGYLFSTLTEHTLYVSIYSAIYTLSIAGTAKWTVVSTVTSGAIQLKDAAMPLQLCVGRHINTSIFIKKKTRTLPFSERTFWCTI